MLDIVCLSVGAIATNCYIVSHKDRDDCVVIDPGYEAERILSAIGERQIAGVMLTHGHFDHIGAAKPLLEKGARLYMHPFDQEMLLDPHLNVSGRFSEPVILSGVVPRLIVEGETLTLGGIAFQVLHTPGHTPGSVCYLAEGHLFTGDTLFAHGYGNTSFPGGDFQKLRLSVKRLLAIRDDCTVHPGHND